MIIEIDDILVSSDIFTEEFCCDLDACKGICCVEGDAGAPVTLDEIGGIEDALDTVWDDMSASAQAVVDKQGVAYTDRRASWEAKTACSHATRATAVCAPWNVLTVREKQGSANLSVVPSTPSAKSVWATA